MTIATIYEPLFGEPDGYDGEGYDAGGADRDGYDRDGNPVSVESGELNLTELWATRPEVGTEFLTYLRSITRDPENIQFVVFCVSCGDPEWEDNTGPARGDSTERVCDGCTDDWYSCYHCAGLYPGDELHTTADENEVCGACRDRYYTYCEACDAYAADDDNHYHENDDSCGCVSPQTSFTVRNDGCEPLANDTRTVITLPAGVISAQGLDEIRNYLRQHMGEYATGGSTRAFDLPYNLEPLGNHWQTKLGNYTKRLSRLAFTSFGIKLKPEHLSQIGCIARDHSGDQAVYNVEVTRELNMSAADFYHEDSCWWGSYSESRCALKTNGGFALRTFGTWSSVTGRAWVMPLRKTSSGNLVATFDTATPDAFMVFNGYGELRGYTAARIVGHMAGWTYRKTGFDCEPMYINAGGYLVAPEDTVTRSDAEIWLDISQHSNLFASEQKRITHEQA
jgi:hypothetical protein